MKRFRTSTGSHAIKISPPKEIEFREYRLPNGVRFILHKDNRNPIVNVTLGYKVGSKDEKPKKKGLAHLFEHMMFQGSENVGKTMHFEYINKSGGVCNAFTMQDATVYYDLMPSNNLEISLWLESDRMNSLNVSEENLLNQKKVVIEEKKQTQDNAPYGTLMQKMFANLFPGSGYETAIIGEEDDINSFTVSEASEFHSNYYAPDNAVLIVSGDIEYAVTEALVEKYFSGITRKNNLERKANTITGLNESKEIVVHDNVQLPLLSINYQTPRAGEMDNYSLQYFADIMANSESSRLHKRLVYDEKICESVRTIFYPLQDAGVFSFYAMLYPGVEPERVRKIIIEMLEEFADKGCSESEFMKVRNRLEFDNTKKFLTIQGISIETIFNQLIFGDVNRINSEISRFLNVSQQDIRDSAIRNILSKNSVTLTYLPGN